MVKVNPLHEFFRDLTTFGGFTFYALMLIITLIWSRPLFWSLFRGLLLVSTVVVLIRLFYFKERPKSQEYHNLIQKIDASSFPSLHTARIVFLAFMAYSIFHNQYVTMVAVLLAALVSYSRIYLQKHDWLDLVGGVVLGGIAWVVG